METKSSSRKYYLDWLRVVAFAGVFFYHCARFFNSSGWHIKNAETSAVADIFTGIFDLWGMPLLFVISGASIFFALRPGATGRFLRDRVLRLLVPLAFGILVLAPPQIYLERLTHGDFQGNFFQFLPLYFTGDLAWTGVHLWYLEYLFLFTLVLTPLFVWLKRPAGQRVWAALSRFSARPGAIFLWIVPFMLLGIAIDPFGLLGPAPSEAILRLLVYPAFLVYGFLIVGSEEVQQAIMRQRRAALVAALVLSLLPPLITLGMAEWGWEFNLGSFVLVTVVAGVLIWSYVLAFLGYGMRYLNANHPLLAYTNEAVLPFYVLHQPVILLLGYFIVPLALPIAAKYLLITPLAFGITLGLYAFLVRRLGVLRFLFGMKTKTGAAGTPAQPLRGLRRAH